MPRSSSSARQLQASNNRHPLVPPTSASVSDLRSRLTETCWNPESVGEQANDSYMHGNGPQPSRRGVIDNAQKRQAKRKASASGTTVGRFAGAHGGAIWTTLT